MAACLYILHLVSFCHERQLYLLSVVFLLFLQIPVKMSHNVLKDS